MCSVATTLVVLAYRRASEPIIDFEALYGSPLQSLIEQLPKQV
jgi:hypothetical protein